MPRVSIIPRPSFSDSDFDEFISDPNVQYILRNPSPQTRLYQEAFGPAAPLTPEAYHFLLSGIIGLAFRNPYVSVTVGLIHGGYHLLAKYLDSGSSSSSYQQNGGPGTKSNYKASRNSRTVAARSVIRTGGRRSGSKPRKKCPPGYIPVWSQRKRDFVCKKSTPSERWRQR